MELLITMPMAVVSSSISQLRASRCVVVWYYGRENIIYNTRGVACVDEWAEYDTDPSRDL